MDVLLDNENQFFLRELEIYKGGKMTKQYNELLMTQQWRASAWNVISLSYLLDILPPSLYIFLLCGASFQTHQSWYCERGLQLFFISSLVLSRFSLVWVVFRRTCIDVRVIIYILNNKCWLPRDVTSRLLYLHKAV